MRYRNPFFIAIAFFVLSIGRVDAAIVTGKATPPEQLKVPAGFKIELLRSADAEKEGSWVSMAIDDKGRLYLSPQYMIKGNWGGLARVTLGADGQIAKWEPINLPIGGAMGMLWAFDSLYVSGVGPQGQAIYRLKDTNGDDILDSIKLFKAVPGGSGEHGAHALILGPDKKIYIAHGNSAGLIDGISPESAHQHYAEDHLLPRIKDPVATFFDTLKVPYGYIVRTDENGQKWELFAGGFRNEYDIDFNTDGELFTFDSDMEWDVGLPWYRPTRILHVTSGAEYGFREGNTKWPAYYEDSLGSVVDVGTSSPTGIKFGTKSNFPAAYRSALFAFDWTYGRILAIHMRPKGASYTAEMTLPNAYLPTAPTSSKDVEEFMTGKGMPVTDLEFGKDGAMYFTVGGRGTQSGLYRISYVEELGTGVDANEYNPVAEKARSQRRMLEVYHGKQDAKAGETAWPFLASEDRTLRYAARIAIESQPVKEWQERALAEKDPRTALTALIALARLGDQGSQGPLLMALTKFPLDTLTPELRLEKYRVIELALIRHGKPSDQMMLMGISKLSKQYPAKTYAENHELSQLLVFLGAPDVVEKTLKLLESSEDPAEQIWFANMLSESTGAWTTSQREAYFNWFNTAAAFKGGNSAPKFVGKIRDNALSKLTAAERQALAPILNRKPATVRPPAQPAVARKFVKTWTVADLDPELPKASSGRNFARGKEIFSSLQCITCHRFANDGGGVGPDITAVSGRFNRHDLLVSIVEPSKAISEQYASYIITMKDGKRFQGQIANENNDILLLITDPIQGTEEHLHQGLVVGKKMSPVSIMPTNLLDVLNKDEVLDLLAYIESGGNEKASQFK